MYTEYDSEADPTDPTFCSVYCMIMCIDFSRKLWIFCFRTPETLHPPEGSIAMMQIDCEVTDTKLLHIHKSAVPDEQHGNGNTTYRQGEEPPPRDVKEKPRWRPGKN